MNTGQQERFIDLVQRNPNNAAILARMADLDVPDCYLVSGCLFQTVWNCLTDQPAAAHILDYDVFYCDAKDTGWDAEDRVIRRAELLFCDLGVTVQIRNQARVHLWYEQRFGIPCEPLVSSRDGIDHFLNQSSCFGIRRHGTSLEVYAPFGFEDLFSMTVRPNPRRALPSVYYQKANRWRAAWSKLHVLPWPT